jgi:hypothetical protein
MYFFQTRSKGDADEHSEHFNNAFAPPVVNFNEIYTNSLSMLAEEPGLTTGVKEEDFHLPSIPSQLVEFHSQSLDTTKATPPPPMYILNSSYLKDSEPNDTTTIPPTTNVTSTTDQPEESSVKVIPIKKNYQRGVLDLLFPASRVRAFKSVFDTFRKILSHTFRKR